MLGDRKLIKETRITFESRARAVKRLWNRFAKKDELWNLWRFRKIIIDVYKYKVLFVVAKHKRKIVGVLPLWFNSKDKYYEYVSGWWPEKNRPFGDNPGIIRKMIRSVPGKVCLYGMTSQAAKLCGLKTIRDDDHYGLDLNKCKLSWEGYLSTLKRKKRQTIKWDIRQTEKHKPIVRYDKYNDLLRMFKLNIKRMDQKVKKHKSGDQSIFLSDSLQKKVFRKIWQQRGKDYQVRIISVLVRKQVVSCDFNVIYKKNYYCLQGSQAIDRVAGIGAYANMLDIQDAIENECRYVDFCMEDHRWKSKWFKGSPRYIVSY